jgi:hypothetical protein
MTAQAQEPVLQTAAVTDLKLTVTAHFQFYHDCKENQ